MGSAQIYFGRLVMWVCVACAVPDGVVNRWLGELAMSSPAQPVKTAEKRSPSEDAPIPTVEFDLVDEASAESFPASDPPAWQFRDRESSLKHARHQ